MKEKMFVKTVLAGALLGLSGVSSASVWAPTNEDSNFATLSALFNISQGVKFGIFEDTASLSASVPSTLAAPVLTFNDGATVTFTQNGFNYNISTGSASGTLLGSSHFQLGWLASAGWVTETASTLLSLVGSTTWALDFVYPAQGLGNTQHLFAVDVTPSQALPDTPPAAVPVPAAVWLMASGLASFAASQRRKKA